MPCREDAATIGNIFPRQAIHMQLQIKKIQRQCALSRLMYTLCTLYWHHALFCMVSRRALDIL